MEQIREPVYILDDSFFTDAYQRIKEVRNWLPVKHNGTQYPVYNLYLWAFLKTVKVALHVDIHGLNKTIDGTSFVKSYAEGVEAGEKAFKERFPADPNLLYGEHAKIIVNEMHKALCHEPNNIFGGEGWIASVNNQQPRDITHRTVSWYGYFGGLLKSYDIVENHNEFLFKELIKCEHKPSLSDTRKELSNNEETKTKRGPYENLNKDMAIKSFTSLIEADIRNAIRDGKQPNQKNIIQNAYNVLKSKLNKTGEPMYAPRTLSSYLPPTVRVNLFGEIHRQILEVKKLVTK